LQKLDKNGGYYNEESDFSKTKQKATLAYRS